MGLSEQDSNLHFSDGGDDDDEEDEDGEGSPIEMTLVNRRQKDGTTPGSSSNRSKRRSKR